MDCCTRTTRAKRKSGERERCVDSATGDNSSPATHIGTHTYSPKHLALLIECLPSLEIVVVVVAAVGGL
jgi:hypothetical protein